jgi:hypothetical protein
MTRVTEMSPVIHNREEAREILQEKIASQTRLRNKIEQERSLSPQFRTTFTTIDPSYLIDDAEWKLRWIDCGPDSANYLVAPMQDKMGIPCGTCWSENVGPNEALRQARINYGLNPFSGQPE